VGLPFGSLNKGTAWDQSKRPSKKRKELAKKLGGGLGKGKKTQIRYPVKNGESEWDESQRSPIRGDPRKYEKRKIGEEL